MMNTFARDDLPKLVESNGNRLVSIYMPMLTGVDSRQNPIRFKNLLRSAEEQLRSQGMGEGEAHAFLEPMRAKLDQSTLRDTGQSMAAFFDGKHVRAWHLPIHCDESCTVGNTFHLTPLVRWLNSDAPYYVLAVSQKDVRFFEASRSKIEEQTVPDMPDNMLEALLIQDVEPALQHHTGETGGREFLMHGQGGAPDAIKPQLLQYFRKIDRALQDVLRNKIEPLVFAGVDYLFPIYQEANSYQYLMPEAVSGNPKVWSPKDLQERVWPLVEATLARRRQAELARYGDAISAGRASDRIEEVLPAAEVGAVDLLFVDARARMTGSVDPDSGRIRIDNRPVPKHEDLVGRAITLVLRNSGAVETLEADDVPGNGPMAAIMRYPLARVRETASTGART